MSHAPGQIKFSDNTIMHFEYNGTVDICISCLYNTWEEMNKNWRNHKWKNCTCGKDEDVIIATNYGRGFFWEGKACRNCLAITENCEPIYENHGLPTWWA